MSCAATCVTPSPSNAHCSACHGTFGSVSGFDRHRRGGQCLDPAALRFVRNHNGIWRFPAPDPTARPVWPQRKEATA